MLSERNIYILLTFRCDRNSRTAPKSKIFQRVIFKKNRLNYIAKNTSVVQLGLDKNLWWILHMVTFPDRQHYFAAAGENRGNLFQQYHGENTACQCVKSESGARNLIITCSYLWYLFLVQTVKLYKLEFKMQKQDRQRLGKYLND